MTKNIEKAREIIKNADVIYITAGAGMGVDSGLPDFRGNEGFWNAYPVIANLGHSFVDMANPEWFDSNPKLAWAFYGHRLNLYRDTVPHEGFALLKALVEGKKDYFIFTSNVDGQFQKAGFPSDKIYECHGSIHHFQCTTCNEPIYRADDIEVEVDMEKFEALNIPLCPFCDEVARPNILMFGDWGWDGRRSEAQREKLDTFLKDSHDKGYKIAIIEIGAGTHIPTVRYESENTAHSLGGFVVRINPREYDIDKEIGVGITLGGLAGLERVIT
jgi:NAD-dependent SIR2 family protein deacetylase